ncbi:HNH endonuclease [Halocatena salina]|uniref:HNH endonuclease n=1 Tax=Halocatena salina TaxID=2934340 RepID=A0A8T9ZZ11_9EURY|nr:HNH endonuclease [Halocatena salina]UPM41679.1 HNH endonuclease [Halocatena salina]
MHHIIPVRAFIGSKNHHKENAHQFENVVSLCIDCHRKADFGKISSARLRFLIETGDPIPVIGQAQSSISPIGISHVY